MKAFVSWSGGKDSALACYRALRQGGIEVAWLVTTLGTDGAWSRSHHIPPRLLTIQGDKMGLPVVQATTTWEEYEDRFKSILRDLKDKGTEAGIFGDIDVEPHREWVERVCGETGIIPFLPLWHCEREEVMEEFIGAGFRAVLVAVDGNSPLGPEWLGREIDRPLCRDLAAVPGVDLCGENGEYHTFVYDGPLFRNPLPFSAGRPVKERDHWFLPLSLKQDGQARD